MAKDKGVSAEHPQLTLLDSWLNVKETCNKASPPYCHLLIRQRDDIDHGVWDELYVYIDHAHEGARKALRAPLEDSLHPLHHDSKLDPAFGYPHKLGDKALQGFFGEIMAGIIAEYYVGDKTQEWEVPVYLFRTHIVAFQQLEMMKQTDNWETQILGRTGDDGLAFILDEQGQISAWLACEAKCTRNHSSTLIADNHAKLSQAVSRPIDLLRLIDALQDYRDDDYSRKWISSLRDYWWEQSKKPSAVRYDFSMYACGVCPKRKSTWISTEKPHKKYSGRRNLTCAELHLIGVHEIIRSLYQRMDRSP